MQKSASIAFAVLCFQTFLRVEALSTSKMLPSVMSLIWELSLHFLIYSPFYFSSGSNIAYTLLAAKTECSGEEKGMGYLTGIEKCAVACKGKASLFAYGTNEYGDNHCISGGKCKCLCETVASVDGECDQKGHNGFNLYKYAGMTLICRHNWTVSWVVQAETKLIGRVYFLI